MTRMNKQMLLCKIAVCLPWKELIVNINVELLYTNVAGHCLKIFWNVPRLNDRIGVILRVMAGINIDPKI